jgi:hypothetical protein
MRRGWWVVAVALAACGGMQGFPFDPAECPPPTLQQCTAPITACDLHFSAQTKTDVDAACSLLLYQGAKAVADASPKRSTRRTTLYGPAGVVGDDGGIGEAALLPDEGVRASGLSSFLLGPRLARAARLRYGADADPAVLTARSQLLLERAQWDADGEALTSCAEYVYEKFYEYAAFEDRVVLEGGFNEHRKVVDLAYTNAGGLAPRWAIGSRHLQGQPITQRDGVTPTGLAIPFEAPRPKNDFFRVPAPGASTRVIFKSVPKDANGNPTGEDRVNYLPGTGSVIIELKNLKRRALNWAGVEFDNQALAAVIDSGREKYVESFEWHRQMRERNQSVHPDVLDAFRLRREDFTSLLNRRERILERIATLTSRPADVPVAVGNRFESRWWLDPLWQPSAQQVDIAASTGVDVRLGNLPHPGSALTFVIATFATSNDAIRPQLRPAPMDQLASIQQVKAACAPGTNPVICLAYQLANVDQLIEAAIVSAQGVGCLDVSASAGPAPCDWHPKDFTVRLAGLADAARERAYRTCTENVDSWNLVKTRAFQLSTPDGGGVNYPAEDYTVSPTAFERYVTRFQQYLWVLVDVIEPLVDRETTGGKHRVRLHRTEGDSCSLGNDWFGAETGYSASFALDGVGSPDGGCAFATTVAGEFHVTAKVLTAPVPLVETSVNATDTRFRTLGKVLSYTWDVDEPLATNDVAVFREGDEASQTFFEDSKPFTIGPVVLSLHGSVSGAVGYTLTVEAGRRPGTSGGCSVNELGVWPRLKPYAQVDAQAAIALEALIARAGIRGRLVLVRVDVPVDGELSLGPLPTAPDVLAARFGLGARLDITLLSGTISAYAEVGVCPLCEDFEAPVVSWDGYRERLPLFDWNLEVPLADLDRVVKIMGVVPRTMGPP